VNVLSFESTSLDLTLEIVGVLASLQGAHSGMSQPRQAITF
jgi:hypothetical protein